MKFFCSYLPLRLCIIHTPIAMFFSITKNVSLSHWPSPSSRSWLQDCEGHTEYTGFESSNFVLCRFLPKYIYWHFNGNSQNHFPCNVSCISVFILMKLLTGDSCHFPETFHNLATGFIVMVMVKSANYWWVSCDIVQYLALLFLWYMTRLNFGWNQLKATDILQKFLKTYHCVTSYTLHEYFVFSVSTYIAYDLCTCFSVIKQRKTEEYLPVVRKILVRKFIWQDLKN